MPVRTTPLVTNHIYHVYNRGAAKQPVYLSKRDFQRFLLTLLYYRFSEPPVKLSFFLKRSKHHRDMEMSKLEKRGKRLISLLSYVLMPNHFHLVVKQQEDNGISTFIRRCINSYTKYFNKKNKRTGALFQGPFKVVRVESDEQLLHLSRYIHLNPLVSFVVKECDFLPYPWSSLSDYLQEKSLIVDTKDILSFFKSAEDYKKFVMDNKDYAKTVEEIKHLTLEET